MFLDGRWHTIVLGDAHVTATPAERLDVSACRMPCSRRCCGSAMCGPTSASTSSGGARARRSSESRVRSGSAAVAFSMYPVGVDDLMAISDAGGIMPPKSTWFEPKLRDGLLSHLV